MQTETPPFFIVGGTVPSDAPCYVTRQADTDLFEALQNAAFCFVLDTRQVGKSSLMARVPPSGCARTAFASPSSI